MVHFKRAGGLNVGKEEPYERGYRKDRYWILGFYTDESAPELRAHLAAYDYKYPKNASKKELVDAVGRRQRGLLSYEKCSVDELLGFCLARKVSLLSERMIVPRLALRLENADDNVEAAFPHFMELPAELRNKIHELRFRDYDEISTEYDQPPITKVFEESLPLFYKCDSYSLTKMPAADLARIKNFKLHWTSISNGARASTHRRVESSAETSQVDNVKKMTTTFGKRAEPESKELKDAIHLVISEIDFRDIT